MTDPLSPMLHYWKYFLYTILLGCVLAAPALKAGGQSRDLAGDFQNPPPAARPRIWWFWGESIVTDSGITHDLEALKKAGFGGVVLYEQVFRDDPDALKSLSPAWLEKVRFAARECARLHLTLDVNAGDGYVAGGPWITPALGMQRLVSADTTITGGKRVTLVLPHPPEKLSYYRDVEVVAFPALEETALPRPRVTATGGIDLGRLLDSRGGEKAVIPAGGGHRYVRFDYGRPVTLRSLTYAVSASSKALVIATQMPGNWSSHYYGQHMKAIPPVGELQASADGVHWRRVRTLPGRGSQFERWDKRTLAFPAVTARYFRVDLHGRDGTPKMGNLRLRGAARIDNWEVASGNTVDFPAPDRTPRYGKGEVIDTARIVDLSRLVTPGGSLRWDAPPGRWTILRLGHTPTGARTKHGRPENMGLECDKLSVKAAEVQFDHYAGVIRKAVAGVAGARLAGVSMDSGEFGSQNWTAGFPGAFARENGYSLWKLLPAMAGYIVASPETSRKFLYDVRRTIADMMTKNYYGTFRRRCREDSMTFTAQAPGIATCMPSDNIAAKGRTDIPMGEFWMTQPDGTMDCKEAASAGHLYGKPIIAAESFTGSMAQVAPRDMKPLADAALTLGINRFVVLAYMHQPWDDRRPGVTEDRFYLPYQRHNTWWDFSAAMWKTFARSCTMMQAGRPVADLLYYLGNNTPVKIVTARMRPVPPRGYDYDVCSAEALLMTRVVDGRIVMPDGMRYRVLVLDAGRRLSLAVARHVAWLVREGATVLGAEKPVGSPTLGDGASADSEVRLIADTLWGTGGRHPYGKGRMITAATPAAVLHKAGLPEDFSTDPGIPAGSVLYAHRRTRDQDIYMVVNHRDTAETFDAVFRVRGRYPRLWDPMTGQILSARDYGPARDGRTRVRLSLEPYGSVFVVFAKYPYPVTGSMRLVDDLPVYRQIRGPWQVSFAPGGGAPEGTLPWDSLISWPRSPVAAVRDYSGTATYTTAFDLPGVPEGSVVLDLGRVDVVAAVEVNGVACGTVWKRPYAVDITKALVKGKNHLVVRVANLWVNRLVTDAGLPPEKRVSWETFNPYKPTDPLLPSGLEGPVTLRVDKAP